MEKKSQKSNSSYLSESAAGFYFPGNHAKMIWQGNKSLIVKALEYKNVVDKVFYIIGDNNCYGALKITSKRAINLKEFAGLAERHRVNDKEKSEWFRGKKLLYAYEFEVLKKFDCPKRVSVPDDVETLISQVEFLKEELAPEPFQTFTLMKPAKEFFNEEKLLDYLFGGI